jgi:hypothetical protein
MQGSPGLVKYSQESVPEYACSVKGLKAGRLKMSAFEFGTCTPKEYANHLLQSSLSCVVARERARERASEGERARERANESARARERESERERARERESERERERERERESERREREREGEGEGEGEKRWKERGGGGRRERERARARASGRHRFIHRCIHRLFVFVC